MAFQEVLELYDQLDIKAGHERLEQFVYRMQQNIKGRSEVGISPRDILSARSDLKMLFDSVDDDFQFKYSAAFDSGFISPDEIKEDTTAQDLLDIFNEEDPEQGDHLVGRLFRHVSQGLEKLASAQDFTLTYFQGLDFKGSYSRTDSGVKAVLKLDLNILTDSISAVQMADDITKKMLEMIDGELIERPKLKEVYHGNVQLSEREEYDLSLRQFIRADYDIRFDNEHLIIETSFRPHMENHAYLRRNLHQSYGNNPITLLFGAEQIINLKSRYNIWNREERHTESPLSVEETYDLIRSAAKIAFEEKARKAFLRKVSILEQYSGTEQGRLNLGMYMLFSQPDKAMEYLRPRVN